MSRLLLISWVVYALILAGLITRTGAIIALAIPLVFFLSAAFLYHPADLHLVATRTLSASTVYPGMPVQVHLSVVNQGSSVEELVLEDIPPDPLQITAGFNRSRAFIPPGEKIELHYTVQGSRCSLIFPDVQVVASDHFNLFKRQKRLPAPARLQILPEVITLRSVPIRPLRTRGFSGPIPSRQSGVGINFLGVRGYHPGDPLRRINWRRIARYEEDLFTNEFEQDRVADVGLILDAREHLYTYSRQYMNRYLGVEIIPLFEYAIQATAALANVFLRDGNRVGLLIYGRSQDVTFPGYGKVQHERILRSLARAKTGENLALSSLNNLPTQFFPARSQIVFVSPLLRNDMPVLVRLRAYGYQILVISPDSVTYEARKIPPQKGLELAVRIARIERVLLLRELQRVGVQVVDWRVDQSLDLAIRRSLGRIPKEFCVLGIAP